MMTKATFKTLMSGMLVISLTTAFTACSDQSPFQPDKNATKVDATVLAKKGGQGKGKGQTDQGNQDNHEDQLDFPLSGSHTYHFWKKENAYRDGSIEFTDNRSKFQLREGALTPPPDIKFGDPVTITMEIDFDQEENELIFTFGPHGCQFDPPAQVKLDYRSLGIELPTLYYINDDGSYTEQTPEQIDINKKWLMIRVDHFSRYAVGWGENFR